MIKTTGMLLNEYKDFQDPYGKMRRMCEQGKLFNVLRGIYETNGDTPGYVFAPVIYGPSYLSFDYALFRHGMMTRTVEEYTSATCFKNKRKKYSNCFGEYLYRDIPVDAFPFEKELIEENGYFYFLASPEKALCDKLYDIPTVRNMKDLSDILFEDIGIDRDSLSELNIGKIEELGELYHANNLRYLSRILRSKYV